MRTVQFENKAKTKVRLAKLVGCETEELIITRNTTESLDTIISGYDWKAVAYTNGWALLWEQASCI